MKHPKMRKSQHLSIEPKSSPHSFLIEILSQFHLRVLLLHSTLELQISITPQVLFPNYIQPTLKELLFNVLSTDKTLLFLAFPRISKLTGFLSSYSESTE